MMRIRIQEIQVIIDVNAGRNEPADRVSDGAYECVLENCD